MKYLKRTIINIVLIVLIFIIYYLQVNFFDWFTIAGVMPNIFIILVLFIGLFGTKSMGIIYGVSIGLVLDVLVGQQVGITAVVFGIIGFVAGMFDKNFSKDNRMTIMIMVLCSTILAEITIAILKYVFVQANIDILSFIKILGIEVIYNLIITIIIYPLIQKFGYYIENEYKGNKILTRYF